MIISRRFSSPRIRVRILARPGRVQRGMLGLLAAFLLAAMAGCGDRAISESDGNPLNPSQSVTVQSVQSAATRNTVVQLQGTVGDRVPLLGSTAYELQDSTGKIWVLTKQPPPTKGQQVVVKGTLRYKSIPLNGKEEGSVYMEQE